MNKAVESLARELGVTPAQVEKVRRELHELVGGWTYEARRGGLAP